MAHWGMLVDLRRCAGCYACVVACQMTNSQRPGVAWSHVDACEWENEGVAHRGYLPHACMQCVDAPCVAVCPVGASVQRTDGIVVVDYDACTGCGACITACPYGARTVTGLDNDSWFFDAAEPAPYEEEGARRVGVAEKCTFCHERVDQGLEPACVYGCPGGARVFGDLDDPESPVAQAIAAVGEGAYRVPNSSFYYVPFAGMPSDLLPGASLAEGGR